MKTLKQNKKCSSKSNACLLKRGKRSESHVLLEGKKSQKGKYKKQSTESKIKK